MTTENALILNPARELVQEFSMICAILIAIGIGLVVLLHRFLLCISLPALCVVLLYFYIFRYTPIRMRIRLTPEGITLLNHGRCIFFLPKDQIALIEATEPELGSRLEERRSVIVWVHNKVSRPVKSNRIYISIFHGCSVSRLFPDQVYWISLGEYNRENATLLVSELKRIYGIYSG